MKNDNERIAIPEETWEYAEKLMTELRVLPVKEFDSLVLADLRKHYQGDKAIIDQRVNGSSRIRGLNAVDWIKAHLTKTKKTVTVKELMLWIPLVGSVHSVDLSDRVEAWRTLQETVIFLRKA